MKHPDLADRDEVILAGIDVVTRFLYQPAAIGQFRTPRETSELRGKLEAWVVKARKIVSP